MTHGTDNSTDNATSKHQPSFKFSVDGKPYESETQVVTGAHIKVTAGINPAFGLFLEGHGKDPDLHIADHDSVDLSRPGREQFHTVPPATFGCH